MSESTAAIYISMATVLLVWVTIAVYLVQVGAQLRAMQNDLKGDPPGPVQRSEETTSQSTAAPESPSVAADQWTWMAWYGSLTYGCTAALEMLSSVRETIPEQQLDRWQNDAIPVSGESRCAQQYVTARRDAVHDNLQSTMV